MIDEDYRGNVGVLLFNHSDQEFEVKRGDRVAQLICERIFYPVLKEIEVHSHSNICIEFFHENMITIRYSYYFVSSC